MLAWSYSQGLRTACSLRFRVAVRRSAPRRRWRVVAGRCRLYQKMVGRCTPGPSILMWPLWLPPCNRPQSA
eukprot:3174186-Prymnesium_polylepis.2